MTGRSEVVAYLAPFYLPAIGGASVYVSLLSRKLLEAGVCRRFVVITESYPGQPDNEAGGGNSPQVLRMFPFRAGKSTKDSTSYLAYAAQNVRFFWLASRLAAVRADVLFIHGSFFNNPSLLFPALANLRRRLPGLRLVLDLRDPKFPESLVRKLGYFDGVVSCSQNISSRLDGDPKVVDIPVMIEPFESGDISSLLSKHGLVARKYLFCGSSLSREKGVGTALALLEELRSQGRDLVFAVAGKRRYWGDDVRTAVARGHLVFLGELTNREVRAIASAAWLDVNLSTVDSLPRHSVEAMSAGARVLLPAGVPEFIAHCPEYVVDSQAGIPSMAKQAIHLAEMAGPCPYPWRLHLPENVVGMYSDLLSRL